MTATSWQLTYSLTSCLLSLTFHVLQHVGASFGRVYHDLEDDVQQITGYKLSYDPTIC